MRRSILVPSAYAALALLIIIARPASAQTTGTIAGTVTATTGGAPISFALVQVFDSTRTFVTGAATSSEGAYSVSTLTPGTYYLRFSATGFVSQAYSGVACAALSCTAGVGLGVAATPIVVTAGGTTTANASLDTGATISGTVTRASDGTPISGLAVLLYDSSTSLVPPAAVTTSDGTYTFTGVPFGTYYARTQRDTSRSPLPDTLDTLYGGALCPLQSTGMPRCRIDSGTPIVVSTGTPSATANFSLPSGGGISGGLWSGHPGITIPNVPMSLYQGSILVATTTTNNMGNFVFAGLDPGTYFVRTNAHFAFDEWYLGHCVACPGVHPTPITVTAGATTVLSVWPFLLAPEGGGISGTLSLPGLSSIFKGFASIPAVQIYNTDGTLVGTWQGTPPAAGDTVQWAVSLPAGTYYVRTSSVSLPPFELPVFGPLPGSGYWVDTLYDNKTCVAADCDPRLGTPVTVTNLATTTGINFSLDLGAQISGRLDAGFEEAATLVQVYDSRGVLLPQRSGNQSEDPSSHAYAALGLPAGTYYLVATSLPTGASRVLYDSTPCDGCAVTSGTPITVALGDQKTGINFPVIAERKISGTIRSDSSTNPPNQLLSTISVEADGPNGQFVSSTTSLADGTYTIRQLTPGTYTISTHNTRGFVDQVYATPVVVPSGSDVSGIDFTLSQGQAISGTVIASGGGPLTSAGVTVYVSSPSSPAAHVTTDSTGAYSATVPTGSYFVQTDPINGYAEQIYNGVACPQAVCPTASATTVSVASTPVTGVNFTLATCTSASIAPVSLAQGAVGIAYRQALLASGASGSVQFAVSSGTLPPGLTLDPTSGVLSGMPTTSGQFTFTIAAVDGSACAGSRTYTLDVPPCVVNGAYTTNFTQTVPAVAGAWDFPFTTTCGPMTATSNASWITNVIMTFEGHNFSSIPAVGYQTAQNTGGPRQGTITIGSRVLTVVQAGAVDAPPFGAVDTPADGSVVSGSVAITGWALDNYFVSDVAIFRDPVAGESSQIFVGYATFVQGARPDVAATYPAVPYNTRAGWGYLLLTNMLPNQGNGTFRFWVYADAPGPTCFTGGSACVERTLIGTKTINVVNSSATAPFGAIDTPGQGATISGSAFVNFGWALTPQPKTIPFDGSTIQVLIDGVPVGTVTAYNFFRMDVSTLFPGLNNSAGPVGYRMIDTTALSEGLHTIAWLATDDGGVTMGIGSRFFTVQNSAWQPSLRANLAVTPPALTDSELAHADSTTAVPPRVNGVDLGRQVDALASVPLDATGARTVAMTNLQVLQLSLNAGSNDPVCTATYAGYLVVNGELAALPVGSSLDPTGTFYWHPSTAFFGTYQLLFVRTSCDRTQQRIPVVVTIR